MKRTLVKILIEQRTVTELEYTPSLVVVPGDSLVPYTRQTLVSAPTLLYVKWTIHSHIIIRVQSGFSLVENRDLLEDRRTLTPF